MPFYHKLGDIPNKRHTVFKSESGKHYYEELFGTIGFVGMSSLVYHSNRPTQVKAVLKKENIRPDVAVKNNIKSRLLKGFDLPKAKNYLESRTPILINKDCHISLAAPSESMTDCFYKNTDADELIFIHKGSGVLKTMLGNLDFSYGDYLLIPRGIIYQIKFNDTIGSISGSIDYQACDDELCVFRSDPFIFNKNKYPKVYRGGSWNDKPDQLLTYKRFYSNNSLQERDPQIPKSKWWNTDAPNIGFRIVRVENVDSEPLRDKFWNN